ncbi:flagellar hook capping FlgD N-terminal domain-containing protein [Paenibacillus sp. D2_2]|uniref:flagellar hook assembly protein FlgD n=1 Tax=Paenibacillus sp. D2_2 TaxID=3073092 RepID=UPI002815BB27|nr:flagellar hook capping FlgD N-terminal domain-containing protein [Paenibacillus sp. D2_2]WMT39187.1 flagellar hook capping FlgD N-terminal domain-containing protein [Paenibacillus sp. D2_2]
MADVITSQVMWPNYSAENVAKASKLDNSLGKDSFLKLLITQMGNQDPLSPMDNKDTIAQLAQFTSVEQLMNISDQIGKMSQSLGNTSGLIGKVVSWNTSTSTGEFDMITGKPSVAYEKASGVVDAVIVRGGEMYVKVGNQEIEVSKIERVENPQEAEEQPPVETAPEEPPVDQGAQSE